MVYLWDQFHFGVSLSLGATYVWRGIWKKTSPSNYEGTHFKVGFFPSQEVSTTFLGRRSSLIKVGYTGHSN